VVYIAAAIWSAFRGEPAGADPWDARTLEWSIPSPPPEYNFAVIPTVRARDAWWHEKHGGAAAAAAPAPAAPAGGIHLPDRSWYPLTAGAGLLLGGLCFAHDNLAGSLAGVGVLVLSIYLWALEGPGGYHVHPEEPAAAPAQP